MGRDGGVDLFHGEFGHFVDVPVEVDMFGTWKSLAGGGHFARLIWFHKKRYIDREG
jgi:hypothetical protein